MSKDLIVGQNTTLLGITMIEIDTVQGPKSIWVPRDEVESYINVGAKRVNQNGTYIASNDSLDGYSSITVNVPPNVGTKTITKNGTYQASSDNIDGFSSVTVNVENNSNLGIKDINKNGTYTALSDNLDGYYQVKVAVKGTVLGGKEITANGSYKASDDDFDGYDEIEVDVPPNVGSKVITANGDYQASSDNYDGYSSVSVNVPPNVGTKTITENGTYLASSDNLDGYSTIEVNVAKGSGEGKEVIIVKEDGSIEFPSEEIGETLMLQDKTVTSNGVITPDTGYNGLRTVTVAVSGGGGDNSQIIVTDEDGNIVLPTVTLNRTVNLQEKTVTQNGLLTPDSGYDGFSSVEVNVSGGGGTQGVFRGTSAPQADIGNNGDYYIQDIPLPSSINYLEYLESSGTQYINTNIKGDQTTTVYVKFRTAASNPDGAVFGARQSKDVRQFCIVQDKTARAVRLDYYNTNNAARVTLSPDTVYEIIHGQVVYNASGKIAVIVAGTDTFETPGSIYIFGMNNNGTLMAPQEIKIYRLTIRKNDLVVADFIPALDENNVPCMYEAVSGTYYRNAGSGMFAYGSAMSPIQSNNVYKKVGGTWSVITQSGVCTV